MRFACLFIFIFNLFTTIWSEDSDALRIAVSKDILNEFIFEGKELTVLYTIYNFHGSRAIRNVELFDIYPDKDFSKVHGSYSARWSVIPASSNVTHAVVVIPQVSGVYNFTSASVVYLRSEGEDAKFIYSSSPGPMTIFKVKEYNKHFTSHAIEWIGFALIVTPCLLIPYMLWYSSASKY